MLFDYHVYEYCDIYTSLGGVGVFGLIHLLYLSL
jgi:hypothetical protein